MTNRTDGGSPAARTSSCPDDKPMLQRIDVGEVTLNVACQGKGKLALLLHGWPEFHGTWNPIKNLLVEHGYRVVVPDQRGYNLSDKPEAVEAYEIDHLVRDVVGLLDQVAGTEKVFLIGHDWGGIVAWVVAHRYPERLRALAILAGPHPDVWCRPEIDPVQAMAADQYVPLVAAQGGEAMIDVIGSDMARYLSSEEQALHREAWNKPGARVAMNNWYRANVYPMNRLPTGVTVDVKTLVLWGSLDPACTPSELQYFPNYVRDLTVFEDPDVDHWVQLQKLDVVLQRLLDIDQP